MMLLLLGAAQYREARVTSPSRLPARCTPGLPATSRVIHTFSMFIVTEADADAIRAAFHEQGELSAAIEVESIQNRGR